MENQIERVIDVKQQYPIKTENQNLLHKPKKPL